MNECYSLTVYSRQIGAREDPYRTLRVIQSSGHPQLRCMMASHVLFLTRMLGRISVQRAFCLLQMVVQ
jgi:hypothetical protein